MVIYGCFPQLSILYIATIIKADSIINDCYIFNVVFGVYISVKVSGWDETQTELADLHLYSSKRMWSHPVQTRCGNGPELHYQVYLPLTSGASTGDQFTSGELSLKQFSEYRNSFNLSSRHQRYVGAEFWT